MTIESFELFTFQIPLKYPLKISNEFITNREGLVLKICDEDNHHGFGEISPLPGLHRETLPQAIDQISIFLSNILNEEISQNLDLINNGIEPWLDNFNLYPTVQFGFEAALISLLAMQNNNSIFDYFNTFTKNLIEINALLSGTSNQIIKKTNQYLSDGFTVFKLKVGRNKLEEDIDLVNKINTLINGKAKLRLDTNQAWTINETLYFVRNIDTANLEYIEEPLKEFKDVPELLEKIKIPIALDENILNIFEMRKNLLSQIEAVIIKPTVLGSISKTIELINTAEINHIMPVISDTFQSGLGLSTLISIAGIIKEKIAMGFDTYSWLQNDILNTKLQFSKNIFSLKNLDNIYRKLDYSYLKKIL